MLKTLILTLAILGGAAFFTKPTQAETDAELRVVLRDAITAGEIANSGDAASALLLAACRADAAACANLVRTLLNVTYEDRTLYARVGVSGFGRQATCYALYTRLFCPGGFTA